MRAIAQFKNYKWGQKMLAHLLVMGSLVLSMTSALAAEFPTSENPAKGNWTKMKPSSFSASMASVIAQCNRAAQVSGNDRLTTAMCQKLSAMIQGKQCEVAMVPDGIVFDLMNGHESGQSRITFNVKKVLGRSDRALICNLGNRTFAYFFTGEDTSCQNVAVTFVAPPLKPIMPGPNVRPTPVAPPVDPSPPVVKTAEPAPPKTECRWVLTGMSTTPTQVIEIQGRILDSCLGPWVVPGQILFVSGGATTTRTWVCN